MNIQSGKKTGARAGFASWLGDTNDVTKTFLSAGRIPGLVNIAGGLPDSSLWPVDEMSELAAKAVREHFADTLAYSPIDGLPELRDYLAERYSSDTLKLTRENVLVTTGGMQALELIGKVLLNYGDIVASQAPAYLGALDAWKPRMPRYRCMHMEASDFDPVACMDGAQFAYTVPNFSNPTGRLVGLKQRKALVAASSHTGAWLVEDDPYGALYYDSAQLPTLLSLASSDGQQSYNGNIVYFGSVSKELAPGLRTGWVIASPEMITNLTTAKQGSDMCTSGLNQQIVLDCFQSGLADRMLPNILNLYRKRRDALCAAMETHLSDLFDWEKPSGGMFVWATAKDARIDTDELMQVGLKHGVCISPSSVFDPAGRNKRSARINFTFNTSENLEEGIRRLAVATKDLLQGF